MSGRDYLTIGEVVQRLQPSYPDLSISKVRFLEEEGLDRARAHCRRLPQVLAGRRGAGRDDPAPSARPLPSARGHPREARRFRSRTHPSRAAAHAGRAAPSRCRSSAQKRVRCRLKTRPGALGIPVSFVRELAEFGIVEIAKGPEGEHVERADVASVHAAWDLRKFGVEPRHLRMYEHFAEREAALFSQILMPAFRHSTAETRQKLAETLNELCESHRPAQGPLAQTRAREGVRGSSLADGRRVAHISRHRTSPPRTTRRSTRSLSRTRASVSRPRSWTTTGFAGSTSRVRFPIEWDGDGQGDRLLHAGLLPA